MTAISSDHHVQKRRRRCQHTTTSTLTLALMGMLTMSSIANVAGKRAFQLSRGRSFISRSRPSSAFVTSSSLWKERTIESVHAPTSPFVPISSSISSLSPSALHMANRGRSRNRSSRSDSAATATAVLASKPVPKNTSDKDASNNNNSNLSKLKKQSKPTPTKKKKKKEPNTGRLRLLPPLEPSNEILSRAQRQTYHEIKDDTTIANQRLRTRKRGAQTIDSLSQKLCRPLKETVQTYERELRNMHPFEKVVMELTVRARQKKDGLTLSTLLEEIHEGRKELLQLGKDWIAKIKTSESAREAYDNTEEAKEVLAKVFLDLIEEPYGGVRELQKSLRNVPFVRLDCPAVVLVGAPNVGKSSIVRAISSGTPEVNNYPFTTRGMTLGHVQVFWESEQEVALGNVAGVSIPSEQQLVQERLMKRGIKSRRMKEKEALIEFAKDKNVVKDVGVDLMEHASSADHTKDAEKEKEDDEGEEIVNVNVNDFIVSAKDASIDNMEDNEGGEDIMNNDFSAADFSGDDERSNNTTPKAKSESTISKKIFPISQLCQIMDSPGILRRDESEDSAPIRRNEMEELTLAAMAHLPTAVMYVMDLSGGAGDKCSSVEDQLVLRRELRARFPRRPWIDVISKVDLGIVDGAKERLVQILEAEQGDGDVDVDQYFIELSIKEGEGVEDLRQEVMRMLGEVRVVLDAMAATDGRSARA